MTTNCWTVKNNLLATVCKTVHTIHAVSYRTVVLSVCNVGVLWSNGWMDQDETWHAGMPRPHCITIWWPTYPSQKGQSPLPNFLGHVRCGQMAGWIKMLLGMEVGLGPGDCVRWGTSSIQKGHSPPPQKKNWPMSIVAKQLDASEYHLVRR